MALGSLSPVHLDCLATFSFPPSPSLCLPRARSAHTTTSFNPLSPSSTVSCLLHLLLHPPSLLHFVHNVQPAAKSLSWFPFFFSLSSATPSPALPPANNPTPSPLSLSLFFFLSPSVALLFFPRSPEVRLATSYPKRRKLPVNVISLLIRFSSRFSRTADPTPPSP